MTNSKRDLALARRVVYLATALTSVCGIEMLLIWSRVVDMPQYQRSPALIVLAVVGVPMAALTAVGVLMYRHEQRRIGRRIQQQ